MTGRKMLGMLGVLALGAGLMLSPGIANAKKHCPCGKKVSVCKKALTTTFDCKALKKAAKKSCVKSLKAAQKANCSKAACNATSPPNCSPSAAFVD